MKNYIFILFSIILFSCKTTTDQGYVKKPMPNWVKSTPVSSIYYIGIGTISKTNPSFRLSAQKNALENLASQISVVISGESILYSLETNEEFKQEFSQNIKLQSKEELEGFEMVDSWEDEEQYWVYYQLSKSKFAQIKAERKNAAVGNAKAKYVVGLEYESKGDLKMAYTHFVQSLDLVNGYLETSLKTHLNGNSILLDQEIIKSLRRIEANIDLELPFKTKKVMLGSSILESELFITARDIQTKKVIAGLPIVFEYKSRFTKYYRKPTNSMGVAGIDIRKVKNIKQKHFINAHVDFPALAGKSTKNHMVLDLIGFIDYPPSIINLDVFGPKVFIQSKMGKFGKSYNSKILTSGLKAALIKSGFELTTNKNKADILLKIECNTSKNQLNSYTKTAFIAGSIEMSNLKTKEILYSAMLKQTKGVKLTYDEANEEAYSKFSRFVKDREIPKFATQYFSN